ncbi:hypothetical protein Bhyg_13456 [Pseudolycoriella hygida]|uniref:Uncharacterized protein n=1 Tax=Pseudolycoriella hygida TaxID=35572 RepID=A0A9Q0MPN2_9DIPT|nr:hypothetical protein Bhyg_13456 [Pseudolycoriella hygida]
MKYSNTTTSSMKKCIPYYRDRPNIDLNQLKPVHRCNVVGKRKPLIKMSDHYGDESQSASDQEELVGETDIDEDCSDTEEMQFTFCKTNIVDENSLDTNTDNGIPKHSIQSKFIFFGMVFSLLLSAFVLLICFPLYQQQLNVGENKNAYGALLFVSTLITLLLVLSTLAGSWILKWKIVLYKLPLPWRRFLTISSLCGVAGTVCTICSYQRVSCHLQDPLKGLTLAFAILFYFLFCKKMMGLQKIFSATTAVVGLFISVDYGLCDGYRCRGIDVGTNNIQPTGWQGHAFWSILYVIGLALWTLHLSLLEGEIVQFNEKINAVPPTNLLTTVSRIVSNIEISSTYKPDQVKPDKRKPKALHLTMWIHIFSLFVAIVLGWIDLLPESGPIRPVPLFWQKTGQTFLCHLNIQYKVPAAMNHQATLDFLSNLTPGSSIYNETVQKLRRNRRHISHKKYFHKRININNQKSTNSLKFNDQINETISNRTVHLHWNEPEPEYVVPATNQTNKMHNKENIWKKYKNHMKNKHRSVFNDNPTPVKVSRLILNDSNIVMDCKHLMLYSFLLAGIYVMFVIFLIQFLFMTESAVFTVAVVSASLPIGGIFWSLFELKTIDSVASIIWSPEVTGELICSLLGSPIVVLGLVLFSSAHFSDTAGRKQVYSSLLSAD